MMMKSFSTLFVIVVASFILLTKTNGISGQAASSDDSVRSNWLSDAHRNRVELFKKWLGNKPIPHSIHDKSQQSPYNILHSEQKFKGASLNERKIS